jgi:molybdenum cofactor guanylyltransferase
MGCDMSNRVTIGVILAGGRGQRMGGAKAFIVLGGDTLIARAIARAREQVDELLVNANGDPARFAQFGFPVIADSIPGYLGPLAGIFAALAWTRANRPQARWLASFACDCPFFPLDVVQRLRAGAEATSAHAAVAASGGRNHPVFGVWKTDMLWDAHSALVEEHLRKVDDFLARIPHIVVPFACDRFDPFLNINTEGDLACADELLRREKENIWNSAKIFRPD